MQANAAAARAAAAEQIARLTADAQLAREELSVMLADGALTAEEAGALKDQLREAQQQLLQIPMLQHELAALKRQLAEQTASWTLLHLPHALIVSFCVCSSCFRSPCCSTNLRR